MPLSQVSGVTSSTQLFLQIWIVTALKTVTLAREYCSPESFEVTCKQDEVILMERATYGRMRAGRCIGAVNIGCNADVLGYMDYKCSGKQSCKIDVNDLEKIVQPCSKDYKAYLDAEHKCVKVSQKTDRCDPRSYKKISGSGGYILGNGAPRHHRPVSCSTSLSVEPGQRMVIYLYNLSYYRVRDQPTQAPIKSPRACQNNVVIQEGGQVREVNLCEGRWNQRKSQIFTSKTHQVSIQTRLAGSTGRDSTYLIEYEAIGCPNLKVPKGSWMERRGDDLVVRCNATDETWYITCQGSEWIGTIGNCSTAQVNGFSDSSVDIIFGDGIPFQQGLALAIGVGVIVGAILGAILLVCVYTIRKGRREIKNPVKTDELPAAGRDCFNDEERCNYPALLNSHDKAHNAGIFEYTHVWDVHQQHLDSRNDSKCSSIQGTYDTSKCPQHHVSPCPHNNTRFHIYETSTATNIGDCDAKLKVTDVPTGPAYFELDPESTKYTISETVDDISFAS